MALYSKFQFMQIQIAFERFEKKWNSFGGFRYKIEELARPPPRCIKCKKLDHFFFNCPNGNHCGKCGENDHNDDKCKGYLFKCVNCGENRSFWYKGCKIFKEKFRNSVRQDNRIDRPLDNSKNFYRTYSAEVNKPDYFKEILAKANLTEFSNELTTEIPEEIKENV
ncbi:unnamed protein product, partial [Brachionus calyciflorus]